MLQVALWDIDGTLLRCPSTVTDRHELAIRQVRPEIESKRARQPGRTDFEVIQGKTREVPDWSLGDSARALTALEAITRNDLVRVPCQRLPGVVEALVWMRALGWKHALLTGNTRVRAMSKLESAGLAGEFDWSLSTFGDTAANRPELARRAARALADSTIDVAVAIGDTPLDVSAAQFAGLPVVAIASGSFNVSRLRRSQPDLVIEDLVTGRPSLDALLRILTERRASR